MLKPTRTLITMLAWAMPFAYSAQALPSAIHRPGLNQATQATRVRAPRYQHQVQQHMERRLKAIVQLEGLTLPPPRTQGQAVIPLDLLPRTRVFTFMATLGDQPGRFLLDTGASTTMVSTPLVQKLQLQGNPIPQDRLAYAVAGNECTDFSATLHQLPTLTLPGAQVQELRGLQFANTIIPEGVSGVMGMDVLSQFDLHLIPRQRELRLLPPTPLPAAAIDRAIPLQKKLGVMLASLKINGQGPFTFMIDTGADSTFISQKMAQQLQLETQTPIKIRGFCGLEDAARTRLTSVRMQQHERSDLDAIILSSSILKVLDVDGILGQNFLNYYQQYWRFQSRPTSADADQATLILSP